jgi:hypothetical protein
LKISDTAQKAKTWMEELHLYQLPVVEDLHYKGLVSEERLLESDDLSVKLSLIKLESENIFVKAGTHFYDVVKLALKNKMQVIAVLDDNSEFLGVISVNDTASAIAQMFASQGPGGIIVLALKEIDYSLSQISRLVESNDSKILSSFVVTDERDPSYIKVTLKLNRSDLTRIIATFERYDYRIVAHFQESELISADKDRLDMLFKYLNI